MSYLSEELERQLKAANQTIDDVASRSGINRGTLFLWKRGEQTSITPEQLNALAPALSQTIEDHAALVEAHLLDEKFGPASDMVTVIIKPLALLKERGPRRTKGEKALEFLSVERHKNRDLNELLIDLARVLGAQIDP